MSRVKSVGHDDRSSPVWLIWAQERIIGWIVPKGVIPKTLAHIATSWNNPLDKY